MKDSNKAEEKSVDITTETFDVTENSSNKVTVEENKEEFTELQKLKMELEVLSSKLALSCNNAERAEYDEKIKILKSKINSLENPEEVLEKEVIVNKDAPNRADHNNSSTIRTNGLADLSGNTVVGI